MKRLLLTLLLLPLMANAQFITTIAGNGTFGYTGFGGPATAAQIGYPRGLEADSKGNIYIACWGGGNGVIKVNVNGVATMFAGVATTGFSGDGGPASAAQIYGPTDIAIDAIGNVYIADARNSRIRKVDTNGTITTVAGGGSIVADGGAATATLLSYPNGIALDSKGNLYITEQLNNKVRKVNTSGIITTFAGTGAGGYSGDGGAATAAKLNNPCRLAIDRKDNVYIDDYGNSRVRKVDSLGVITLVVGAGAGFSGDGGLATAAQLAGNLGLTTDGGGNIYIADWGNNRIRMIDSNGIIKTIAGTGVAGYNGECILTTAAELNSPTDVAVDGSGHIYISTFRDNRIRVLATTCKLDVPETENLYESISIYPNPASNELTIAAPISLLSIFITDMIGNAIYTQRCTTRKVKIDIAEFPAGIYLIRINGTEVRKFVKQ
jgi:sugar lactone lactonase YvrE